MAERQPPESSEPNEIVDLAHWLKKPGRDPINRNSLHPIGETKTFIVWYRDSESDPEDDWWNEKLLLTCLGPGRYRLEEWPIFASEITAFGDVIEADLGNDGDLYFPRVIEKGNFQTYTREISWEIRGDRVGKFEEIIDSFLDSPEFRAFSDRVSQVGGDWSLFLGNSLQVHVPRNSDFDPEQELNKVFELWGKRKREIVKKLSEEVP